MSKTRIRLRKSLLPLVDPYFRPRIEHMNRASLRRLTLLLRYRRVSTRLLMLSFVNGRRHPALLLTGDDPDFGR
jgi:hypothetical protein